MKTFIVYTLVVVFCGAIVVGISMANESGVIKLIAEQPGNRQPDSTVTMVVSEIKEKSGGLFGIGRSPSLAENFPDAMEVRGKIVSGPNVNRKVLLIIPGYVLPANLKAGEIVQLSLLNEKTCIGIKRTE